MRTFPPVGTPSETSLADIALPAITDAKSPVYKDFERHVDVYKRQALNKDYASFYFESMGNGFMQKGRPVQAGIELRCRF